MDPIRRDCYLYIWNLINERVVLIIEFVPLPVLVPVLVRRLVGEEGAHNPFLDMLSTRHLRVCQDREV